MEILVWSKVLNVLKHAKKWGCLQILDPIPWLIIFPYSLTAKCLCPNTGYPPKLQVLMEKSVIILWIWDIPNVLRQTECFHPGWIRLRVQKASCCKSKGKRDSSCWVKIAQLEPPKDKDFLRVLIDDPAYLINNKYQSLGVWKIVMRMVNWKGFPKILSFFFFNSLLQIPDVDSLDNGWTRQFAVVMLQLLAQMTSVGTNLVVNQ